MINENIIENAMNYDDYRILIANLLEQGKTTGDNQSDEYLKFSELNIQRMKRLDKTVTLTEDLNQAINNLKQELICLVITEAWCGDAAQIVPVINKITLNTQKIELKIILRDDNPEVMNQYLTNGAKSIPKVIFLDKHNLQEIYVWGPRPAEIQKVMMELKSAGVTEHSVISEKIQLAYTKDKTKSIQSEICSIIKSINGVA
jgi:hypothetical protein